MVIEHLDPLLAAFAEEAGASWTERDGELYVGDGESGQKVTWSDGTFTSVYRTRGVDEGPDLTTDSPQAVDHFLAWWINISYHSRQRGPRLRSPAHVPLLPPGFTVEPFSASSCPTTLQWVSASGPRRAVVGSTSAAASLAWSLASPLADVVDSYRRLAGPPRPSPASTPSPLESPAGALLVPRLRDLLEERGWVFLTSSGGRVLELSGPGRSVRVEQSGDRWVLWQLTGWLWADDAIRTSEPTVVQHLLALWTDEDGPVDAAVRRADKESWVPDGTTVVAVRRDHRIRLTARRDPVVSGLTRRGAVVLARTLTSSLDEVVAAVREDAPALLDSQPRVRRPRARSWWRHSWRRS